uniref:G2/mitotic-specific cyclin-B2 n=1 Tax=Knipowitschia caucasica TaxID=637954 RepID=A0AAV2J5Q0_KNICA
MITDNTGLIAAKIHRTHWDQAQREVRRLLWFQLNGLIKRAWDVSIKDRTGRDWRGRDWSGVRLDRMNVSTKDHGALHMKENRTSAKTTGPQCQKSRERTVLGVLNQNELHSSQFSRLSSLSDSSQRVFLGCSSSSGYDVFVEEACEVVLAASGQEVVSDGCYHDDQTEALKHEDARLLLELTSSSCLDVSMQSEHNQSLTSGAQSLWEYSEEIYCHLRQNEVQLRPRCGYLDKHPELSGAMRQVLVDWLVEVALEYGLLSETLFLAVNYLDRFLSETAFVKRGKLQLVGMAALMVAAKYEEIHPPELNEFVYITDSTYTRRQLIRMEHVLLKVLAFKMAAATAKQFLRQFLVVNPAPVPTENLAMYLCELSLLEMDPFLQHKPSIIAASAFCLANYTVSGSLWPSALRAFTSYTVAELEECLMDLHKLYVKAETLPHQAIRDKYRSSSRFEWFLRR